MDKKESEIKITTVLKYFWKAMEPQRTLFYFTLVSFFLSSIITITVPILYKKFFDLLGNIGAKEQIATELIKIIFIVFVLHTISWILFRLGMMTTSNIQSGTMARIRQMSFDYMIKHSYSFFSNSFTGSLVQKVGRFARAFERLYDMLIFNIIPLSVYVVGSIIVVYTEKPIISYIIITWISLIFIFNYFFQKWKLKYDLEATKADSATGAALSDAISNQNTIMSFARFGKESLTFKNVTEDQSRKQKYSWNLSTLKDAFQQGVVVIIEFVIFYYAIKLWQQDLITIGTFVLIQVYIIGLAGRLWDFGRIIRNTYEGFADSKEMVEILETPHEIRDVLLAKELKVTEGKIEFKNISFSFSQTRSVLKNINLTINSGEKIALIGPSGAGKTTIVKLLTRMYDLEDGQICIDGQNIKECKQDSLRQKISIVPQDPILFHRTLMENIRYGKEEASDEEVFRAAKLAHCSEFIENLPLKYETYVGERGIKLSGGERQRVAIARAILKNAPILILDEATSSLDSESEHMIQDALETLMNKKTVIVIAHRLSTIRKMDRVVVIDDGKIVEEGNHNELLDKENSLYKKLWNFQAGGFIQE